MKTNIMMLLVLAHFLGQMVMGNRLLSPRATSPCEFSSTERRLYGLAKIKDLEQLRSYPSWRASENLLLPKFMECAVSIGDEVMIEKIGGLLTPVAIPTPLPTPSPAQPRSQTSVNGTRSRNVNPCDFRSATARMYSAIRSQRDRVENMIDTSRITFEKLLRFYDCAVFRNDHKMTDLLKTGAPLLFPESTPPSPLPARAPGDESVTVPVPAPVVAPSGEEERTDNPAWGRRQLEEREMHGCYYAYYLHRTQYNWIRAVNVQEMRKFNPHIDDTILSKFMECAEVTKDAVMIQKIGDALTPPTPLPTPQPTPIPAPQPAQYYLYSHPPITACQFQDGRKFRIYNQIKRGQMPLEYILAARVLSDADLIQFWECSRLNLDQRMMGLLQRNVPRLFRENTAPSPRPVIRPPGSAPVPAPVRTPGGAPVPSPGGEPGLGRRQLDEMDPCFYARSHMDLYDMIRDIGLQEVEQDIPIEDSLINKFVECAIQTSDEVMMEKIGGRRQLGGHEDHSMKPCGFAQQYESLYDMIREKGLQEMKKQIVGIEDELLIKFVECAVEAGDVVMIKKIIATASSPCDPQPVDVDKGMPCEFDAVEKALYSLIQSGEMTLNYNKVDGKITDRQLIEFHKCAVHRRDTKMVDLLKAGTPDLFREKNTLTGRLDV